MTSMLLILSLLLNIIAFIVIFQLFKQVQSLRKSESGEMEELLKTYLDEIKAENRFLEKALTDKSTEYENYSAQEAQIQPEANIKHEENSYTPQTDHVTDVSDLSLEAQILQLHDKGMTVEDIARKLNCGKTEAELIIKINKKAHINP